jgi:putative transposase
MEEVYRMGYQSKWTAEQKIAIVMESLNTSISIAELCRKHNVTPNAFYGWKEKFLEAGKLGLSSSGSPKNNHQNTELLNENERLKKLIGELTIANDCLKKAMEGGKRR